MKKPVDQPLLILLAVDGSLQARGAARYVTERLMLGSVANELHLVHVLYRIPPRAASAVGRDIVESYYQSEMEEALKAATPILDAKQVRYQIVRRIGNPGPEIAHYARTKQADLVVMGSHGRGAAKGLLLGSAAQSVIADCSVPVLVVRGGKVQPRSGEILVAVDGSAYTRHAIAFLLRHRGLFGADARLTLIHVATPPRAWPFARGRREQRETLEAEYERAMRPARRLLMRAKVAYREARAQGDPGAQIAGYARRHACDLIVMGSHGRGAMTGLLLGSVAQKTLSACTTPLLIVR